MLLRQMLYQQKPHHMVLVQVFPIEYNGYVSEKPHVKGNHVGWI
jgi:hypothetical protein